MNHIEKYYLPIVNHELKLPVRTVRGNQEGPTVLITAGIHGAEYIGIQTALELSAELQSEEIKGKIIFVLTANPQATQTFTRLVVPEDGINLNRVFPGRQDGTLSEKIAYSLVHELQSHADYYLDLHAGDTHERVMPFAFFPGVASEEVTEKAREMVAATDLTVRVKSSATTGAYNYAAITGIPSILIERGGGGVFTKEELESYKKDVRDILVYLGVLEGDAKKNKNQSEIIRAAIIF